MIKATNWSYICIVQLYVNARMETLSLLLIVLSVLITGSAEPVGKKRKTEGEEKQHERVKEDSGAVTSSGRRRCSWSHG